MSVFYKKFTCAESNKAYELLENVTPLDYNCGLLCGNKCCKGSETDGMLLFPFEKEFFENHPDYKVYFDEKYNSDAVVCIKTCNRSERPLSCRIFPFFPYVEKSEDEDKITVGTDVRALGECPVADEKMNIDKKFMRAIRIASQVLIRNDEIKNFLQTQSRNMLDLGKLCK